MRINTKKKSTNSPTEPDFDESKLKFSYNRNKDKEPKRNKSAFVIFSNQMRQKLKAEKLENKEIPNANEMMIKLGSLWRNLSNEEKKPYEEEARSDKIRYFHELEEFWKQNPSKNLQNRTKKNHVKKPCSAYGIFLKEVKDDVREKFPDLKMAAIMKVIANDWKMLKRDQKAYYEEKARKMKEESRKKLGEHFSKNEEEDEGHVKKKICQKQQMIRKRIFVEDLPVNIEEGCEGKVKLGSRTMSTATSTDLNQNSSDIIVKISSCSGFSSPIESEKNDENFIKTENEKNDCFVPEKDFVADMLNYNCTTIEKNIDDYVDFSGKTTVRTGLNPFITALEFEIPDLTDMNPKEIFNKTIKNMIDFDDSIFQRVNNSISEFYEIGLNI